MRTASVRLIRARDYAVLVAGSGCFALAAIFAAGRIWFRALFVGALGVEPLLYAGGFLAFAVVLGAIYAFARPPAP